MFCPNGHPAASNAVFCGTCGVPIAASSPAAAFDLAEPAPERNTSFRDVLLGTVAAIVLAGGGLLGFRAYAGGSPEEAAASPDADITVVETASLADPVSATPRTTVTVPAPPTEVVTTSAAPVTQTVSATQTIMVQSQPTKTIVVPQPTETIVVPQPTETVYVQGGVIRYTYSPEGYSNIRSGPGLEYEIIGRTHDGDQVTITSSDGTWSRLETGGWIANTQLNEAPRTTSYGTAYPVKDQSIRLGPDCDAPEVGVIKAHDTVIVTGANVNGWIPITYNGIVGWASGHYLVGSGVPTDIPKLCS